MTEAILYALRLYEGVVLESTDLPGEETARGAQASRTLSVLVTARDSIINVIRDSHWNEDMIVRFMGAWTGLCLSLFPPEFLFLA